MDREIKQAIIIIIIGICIPLAALPFVTGYDKNKGITDNFYSVGIPITKGKPADQAAQGISGQDNAQGASAASKAIPPVKIPFRFFLAVTVVFIFAAIMKIDRAKRRKKNLSEKPEPTEPK